jgi:uncharacterized protein (DUF952 family)
MELLHILTTSAWDCAQEIGVYAPPELGRDGFLHCCTAQQLDFVLQRHFAGAAGLLVITIETDLVPAMLRWAHSEPGMPPFPHLHGSIPCDAVRKVETVPHR